MSSVFNEHVAPRIVTAIVVAVLIAPPVWLARGAWDQRGTDVVVQKPVLNSVEPSLDEDSPSDRPERNQKANGDAGGDRDIQSDPSPDIPDVLHRHVQLGKRPATMTPENVKRLSRVLAEFYRNLPEDVPLELALTARISGRWFKGPDGSFLFAEHAIVHHADTPNGRWTAEAADTLTYEGGWK
ncbi:MAG: hypothetical protein AAGG46_02145 [Planctomycetota bacterium]